MFKKVSVIIPALNEEKNIGKCLQSLLDIDHCNLDLEIILVDNGSIDKTVELAKKYGVSVCVRPGVKISALRNYGVSVSTGDLLAFVDADCEVSKDWLRNAINSLENYSADAVGSFHVIPKEAGWIGKIADLIQKKKVGSEINYIPSGNLLIKRSCFCMVEGFDESLETSEDVDLCHRLKQAGFSLFIDSRICSVHWGTPKSVKEMFYREIWHGKNLLTVFFRDLRGRRNVRLVLFSCLNSVFVLSILGGILFLFQGRLLFLSISLFLFFSLNMVVAFLDWMKIKKNLLGLFGYTVIYGLARSVSVIGWIFNTLFRKFA